MLYSSGSMCWQFEGIPLLMPSAVLFPFLCFLPHCYWSHKNLMLLVVCPYLLVFAGLWGQLAWHVCSLWVLILISYTLCFLWRDSWTLLLLSPSSTNFFPEVCISLFLFLAMPMACRSSPARDQTWATAVTMPDPSLLGHQGTPEACILNLN